MRKLDKTETLVTIGDMTYVREVTKLTYIVVCVYISSLTQFGYFPSLFELEILFRFSYLITPYVAQVSSAFNAWILLRFHYPSITKCFSSGIPIAQLLFFHLQDLKEEFAREKDVSGLPQLLLTAAVAAGKGNVDTAYDIPGMNRSV